MADKIVIRIQNPQLAKPGEEPVVPEVTVWYWHRIVPAVLILGLGVWGLVMGVRHLLGGEDGKSPPIAIQADKAAVKPAPAVTLPQPFAEVSRPAAEKAPPAVAQTANTGTRDSQIPVKPVSEAITPAGSTTVRSSAIRRLQLTSNVQNGEPVDRLEGTIPMNERGLVKVFLYMETAGLKGRVLFHDWYWKDRLIAHARVPVTRNQQNSMTSKFIDRIMVGPWHVQVVDDRKKVYGEARFEVR